MRTRVRQLSKAYGFLWALRDISFELQPGECVALLGPNGAGKTTLLKLLAALLSPTQGEITLNGARLNTGSSRLRSFIGYLSPHEHIYDGLTLRENLILFAALYGRKENPADNEQKLKAVGLEGWSDQYAAALSSGMKCRLSIAKWLLLKPEMMLLDEPYGVLDGNGVEVLETYIRDLCSSGGIAVIATHHTQRVLRLCSRAIVLERGNIVFDEPKHEPWDSFHRAYGKFTPRE